MIGDWVGSDEIVGERVGMIVGDSVGESVIFGVDGAGEVSVGSDVGLLVGTTVGAEVGEPVTIGIGVMGLSAGSSVIISEVSSDTVEFSDDSVVLAPESSVEFSGDSIAVIGLFVGTLVIGANVGDSVGLLVVGVPVGDDDGDGVGFVVVKAISSSNLLAPGISTIEGQSGIATWFHFSLV